MTDFADLAALAPKHDPASCRREPCGKCADRGQASTPPAVDQQPRTPEPPRAQVQGVPIDKLADLLRTVADRIDDQGTTWKRLHSWQTAPHLGGDERGGGDGGTSDNRDQLEDRRVARYFAEYVDLLTGLLAPLRRLDRLHDLAQVEDRTVHRTRSGDLDPMLAAEAAAAGWCASCWRYEQTCHPREKDPEGHYYDRQHCRRCARFRNEHGITPPVELLRLWHGLGRTRWTTTEVETALAKARGRKAS